MKKIIITLELTLGDIPEAERIELAEMTGEDASSFPRLAAYTDGEILSTMSEIFGEYGFADPDNSHELFAGTDFYATIAASRVLSCKVGDSDDNG